jgi:hypothetical protein
MLPIKRILIAVDLADTSESVPRAALNTAHALRDHGGSEVARRLIAEVVPFAQSLDASIEIVYVRETPPLTTLLAGVRVSTRSTIGSSSSWESSLRLSSSLGSPA